MTMLRSILRASCCLTLLPLLVACGGKSMGSDSGDPAGDAVLPVEGSWQGTDGTTISDECGIELWSDGSAVMVSHIGVDSFSISADELYVACSLTGGDFACGPQLHTDDLSEVGLDAVVGTTIDISGTIEASSTEGSMRLAVSLSCEGPDCGELDEAMSLPCASVAAYDLTHTD
jgi:hypothetical protein